MKNYLPPISNTCQQNTHIYLHISEKGNRRMGRTTKDERGYTSYDRQNANKKNPNKRQYDDMWTNDDDFYATVKEKEQKQREKKKEAQQRLIEGDFLSNIAERNKAFRSRKDALISKMTETDQVCATKSFLVILNNDNEAVFYHGNPILVSKFFTTGLSRNFLSKSFNIRLVRCYALGITEGGIFFQESCDY